MAVYFVTGKLGAGKSLAAVGRIRDYLRQGRRVATNLDIYLDEMAAPMSKETITRLPDKPRIEDLRSIGRGDGREVGDKYYNEDEFGLLVLDELGAWFNSRNWNDKGRFDVIQWFLHARKLRWDVLFLVQSTDVVDNQLKETLCEHLVVTRRLDRLPIPLIGPLLSWVGIKLMLPKIHIGTVFYGDNEQSFKVDRWVYRAKDLYRCYDTGQQFAHDVLWHNGEQVDMRAPYTVLSAYHLRGRYMQRFDWRALLRRGPDVVLRVMMGIAVYGWALVSGLSPQHVAEAWSFGRSSRVPLSLSKLDRVSRYERPGYVIE